ncbi:MAG: hypothetical protein LBE24_10270 [Methylobacillus sp.]|jgi:hypothetical protein|nr:hypothetical protein [Methylobacillus sp.]
MKRIVLIVCFGLMPMTVHADNWPKLVEGKGKQCDEALAIAKMAFKSPSFFLITPLEIPSDLSSEPLLKLYISDGAPADGDTLNNLYDPNAASTMPADAISYVDDVISSNFDIPFGQLSISGGDIYWQKKTHLGKRLVVWEDAWRWNYIYSLIRY